MNNSKLKQLNLKSKYSFKYSFSIDDILLEWNKIESGNIYLDTQYLKAIESSINTSVTFIYIVVYYNNRVVGIVYFQWIEIGHDFFTQEKFPKEINTKLRAYLLKKISGSLLLCGNFFATGTNGFFFKELVPVNIINKIISKLRCELCSIKNTSSGLNFVMVKEFWTDNQIEIQKELNKKTSKFQIDVNMVLDIKPTWLSYDDYLNAMTTKYRTRAKSVIKKTSDIRVVQFNSEEIKKHETEILKLYLAVLKTASFNMIKLNTDSFYNLKKALKHNFIFNAYFKDDKMVAFSTACINKNYLDANYVGIDYSVNTIQPIYQKILHDYVRLAIDLKVNELRFGRTAETIKSSLGAKPQEMNLYVKHMNPILHTLLKHLTNYVKPSSYEIRNPFKKDFL